MAAEIRSHWSLYHILEIIIFFQFPIYTLQSNEILCYPNSEHKMTGRVKPENNFAPTALSEYKMHNDYF